MMTEYVQKILQDEKPALIYIMDPMCSWCWAFRPVLRQVREYFPDLTLYTLPGGLAPDSDEVMPEALQDKIIKTWRRIQATTGTRFNFSFWQKCTPRRSTYPACRALLLARDHGLESQMIELIQSAYYLQAKNPSDIEILLECAGMLGLNVQRFAADLADDKTDVRLQYELNFNYQLGVKGFPTLVLKQGDRWNAIPLDYRQPGYVIRQIRQRLDI